jgi:GAF domain-containing protein
MKATLPDNEAARVETLRRYRILDTKPESTFDDLAALASYVCNAPVALISLVDSERQWFKAKKGTTLSETPRDVAFCAHAINGTETMVVPDAMLDPRFAQNPLVTGEPGIRFYAGAPILTSDGHALGTVCVIDRAPSSVTPAQSEALKALARQVVSLLEWRRIAAELADVLKDVRQLAELLPICAYCKKIRDDAGYWQAVELYFNQQAGTRFSHGICPTCMAVHHPEVVPNRARPVVKES